MHSARTKSIKAFTATELIVTIACLALLAIILLPALAKRNARSPRIACVYNLKNIGLAFRVWATDNHDHFPMQVSVADGGTMELISNGLVAPHLRAMSNELSPKILVCPNDTIRTEATNFTSDLTETNISYFINVDTSEENPTNLLSGDRNLTNQALAGARFVIFTNTSTIGWTKEIHSEKGNLLFGDGHVGQFNNGSKRLVITIPVGTTNRLAVP